VSGNPQLPPVLDAAGHLAKPSTARALHVLTLTPFYPTKADDAAGCFVSEPLDSLAAFGIESTVFALQPFYRGQAEARESGIAAAWLRYLSWPGGMGLPAAGAFAFARMVGRVRALQGKRRIDVVHAHGPLPCGHAAMLLSAELGIPYVVSVHGLDAFSTTQVSGRAGEWCRRISQRVYRSSRRVICISEHVREQVLEVMGRDCRTSVVYNGVNTEMFAPGTPADSGTPTVLSVGNLIPIKGHDLLVRTVAALAPEIPSLNLDVIGDGPERERLERLAQRCLIGERVRFLGRQSRRAVADAVRRCTVFALPSRYEGLGCVYLEAMAAGKPVIGCRGQGIAEIVHHGINGFLVGPDNERELTLALGMLLHDEARRRNLGAAARDTVLDRLTLTQQAENLGRIYRECVREGAG
jgi:glycosyltransferase involved in cell wall biosynthesis